MAFLVIGLAQLLFWVISSRDSLHGYAWSSLVRHNLPKLEQKYFPECYAVAPELFALTPQREVDKVVEMLRSRDIEFRVAPPSGDRKAECVEVYVTEFPPGTMANTINTPIISRAVISFSYYDFNGDGVLMLQVGPRWVRLASWSIWI